jgi:hypothetical protein
VTSAKVKSRESMKIVSLNMMMMIMKVGNFLGLQVNRPTTF